MTSRLHSTTKFTSTYRWKRFKRRDCVQYIRRGGRQLITQLRRKGLRGPVCNIHGGKRSLRRESRDYSYYCNKDTWFVCTPIREEKGCPVLSLARFVTIYLPASRGSITAAADAMLKSRYHQLARAPFFRIICQEICKILQV